MRELRQGWPFLLPIFIWTGLATVARAEGPPTEAASSLTFIDNSSSKGKLLGNVTVTPGKLSLTPFEYRVYFATTGSGLKPHLTPLPMGSAIVIFKTLPANAADANMPLTGPLQGMCLSNESYLYSPLVPCSTPVNIPTGASHLLVRSHNQFGVRESTGKWMKIVDWTGAIPMTPAALPVSVEFVDTDYAIDSIGGVIDIAVPFPEALDISSYRVYWHGKDGIVTPLREGGRHRWVIEVPATGYNTQAVLDKITMPMPFARRLYVAAVNRDGDALEGVKIPIYDQGYTHEEHKSFVALAGTILGIAAGLFILLLIIIKLRFVIVRCCYSPKQMRDREAKKAKRIHDREEKAAKKLRDAEEGANAIHPEDVALPPSYVIGQEPPGVFQEGTSVEYWDSTSSVFLPAVVMSREEVLSLPSEQPPSKSHSRLHLSKATTTGDQPLTEGLGHKLQRGAVFLRLLSEISHADSQSSLHSQSNLGHYNADSQSSKGKKKKNDPSVVADADPARLRRPLQVGEPVEILRGDNWTSGRVEGNHSGQVEVCQYDVRLPDGSLLQNLPANKVRRCLPVGEAVEIWILQWEPGKVVEASPNQQASTFNHPLFVFQDLVVSIASGETITTRSKDVRWAFVY